MPKANDIPEKESVSVRDSLSEAWDKQADPEPEVEATPEATAETGTKVERARDENGKFAKAEKDESPAEPTADAVPAPEIKAIEPEEHWSEADKAAFRNIPPEHRQWVFERYKRLESEFTKRSQESASLRSYRQQLDAVLGPYKQEFALAGMDEVSGIRYLLGVRDYLKNKPAEAMQWLAQQYGVDINKLAEGVQAVDPASQAVNQQVSQLNNQFTTLQQQLYNERYQNTLKTVEAFSQEKDTQGNLKRPHFEAVVDTMTQLMHSGMVQPGDLEGAYTKALALQGLSATPAPAAIPAPAAQVAPVVDEKAKEAEKAAIAAKAKKAAAGVSGGGNAKTDRKMTIREELAARLGGEI